MKSKTPVSAAEKQDYTRTLYVTSTTLRELYQHQWPVEIIAPSPSYYVRCTIKGVVNWDKTLLYTADDLIERNNVKIIK